MCTFAWFKLTYASLKYEWMNQKQMHLYMLEVYFLGCYDLPQKAVSNLKQVVQEYFQVSSILLISSDRILWVFSFALVCYCFFPSLYNVFWDRQFTDHLFSLISANSSVIAVTWTAYSYIRLKSPDFWWLGICFTIQNTVLRQTEKHTPCFPKTYSLQTKAYYSSTISFKSCWSVCWK